MKKSRLLGAVSAVLFTFITVSANASLVGRLPITPGGTDFQAAYDTVLDITWLTNAGLSSLGNWDNRVGWADGLDTANYLGFDGWRLASISVAAGLPTGTATTVVDCSRATEMDCRDNELGYMFFYNLGGSESEDLTGNQTVDGVLLTDVQTGYWSGTDYDSDRAWSFLFLIGSQGDFDKSNSTPPWWAVRDGNVGAAVVPIPSALWLFGSGLLGLIGISRRKKINYC
jgi:hypothetical protein